MNSSVSIYIPRMSTMWTEDGVKNVMQDHRIGTVSHVDFIPINKKPGFGENVDSVVKSAFVHFSDPYLTCDDHYQFRFEMYMGNTEFWEAIQSGKTWKLQVLDRREYWICLKNISSIPRKINNKNQTVNNRLNQDSIVTEQADEINNLKKIINKQQLEICGIQESINTLILGLYCHNNQADIIDYHLKLIYGQNKYITPLKSSIWPTTRQGDENSERIEKLEHIIEHYIVPKVESHDDNLKNDDLSSQEDKELLNKKYYNRYNLKDYMEDEEEDIEEEIEEEIEEDKKRKYRNHRI